MAGNVTTGEHTAKRLVRIRDGNVCTECGMTHETCVEVYGRGLHIHRIVPGSVYTVEGCVLLCRGCHHLAHGWAKPPIYSITSNDKILLDELVRVQRKRRPHWPVSHSGVLGTLIWEAYTKLMKETKRCR